MEETEDNLGNGISFWNKEKVIPLLTSLKLAPGTAEYAQLTNLPSSSYSEDHNPSGIPLYQPSYPSAQKTLKCSHCKATFDSREDQVRHYSLDWHRFNLKQSMQGLNMVTYEQFLSGKVEEEEQDTGDNDSAEEDNDESSDEEDVAIARKPRIFLVNADNEVISIYRSVLQHKKTEFSNEAELVHRAKTVPHRLHWIVILASGGHFAAAVYKGEEVIAHKTFHSYTVRAGQGGAQSSKDNKSATSHPKSAGASLRRYNEQAHNQHVQDLMSEWKDDLSVCHLIFCRCPKSNTQLLFGGQTPILSRTDLRLRTIPFPSKKPNFAEVKKVHRLLSQIYVHGMLKDVIIAGKEKGSSKKVLPPPSSPKSTPTKGDSSPKKLTKGELDGMETHEVTLMGRSSSEDELDDAAKSLQVLTMGLVPEFGSSVSVARSKRRKAKKKTNAEAGKEGDGAGNEAKDFSPEMRKIENFVYTACRTGNLEQLKALRQFAEERDFTNVPESLPNDVVEAIFSTKNDFDFLALKFGMLEKSLLHVTSENAHKDLIWWLLDNGCDPCVKNKKNETPYNSIKVKEAKIHFRRYRAAHPDKFDYEKANIPNPLTKEDEEQQKTKLEEKKKRQKKRKLEKEKEKKKEEERKKKEEEEKNKFLMMSDREKRALAAEKRMLAARSDSSTSRCFQCAADLGKAIPFEYSDFKFCSTACVRQHREKSKPR